MEFDLNHSRSVEATVKKPHDQSEIKENKSQLSMLSTETEKMFLVSSHSLTTESKTFSLGTPTATIFSA